MKLIAYTDGACNQQEGIASYGIVFLNKDGKIIGQTTQTLPNLTNNEAEYMAVIKALEVAKEKGYNEVEIYTDSQLVVNQLNMRFAVHSKKLLSLVRKAYQLLHSFDKYKIEYVNRDDEFLKIADRLSRLSLVKKD